MSSLGRKRGEADGEPWLFFHWLASGYHDVAEDEHLDGRGFMLRDASGVAFE